MELEGGSSPEGLIFRSLPFVIGGFLGWGMGAVVVVAVICSCQIVPVSLPSTWSWAHRA
jgi:hypothetical protein